MKVKAVLFDLDGTLLNTLDDLADSMNVSLKRFGFPQHPVEAYKYFVGDGLMNLVARALPDRHRDAATINRIALVERDEYSRNWSNKTHIYDGIPDLLNALRNLGIATCILSNKPDEFTQTIVKKFLSKWRFAVVRGASKSTPIKPDPSGAIQIALTVGFTPADFLYVGDSGTDMRTATTAGMYPVGALWGFRSKDELIAAGAKALLVKPIDLLNLISK